jgi:hypothetical protein
VEGDDRVGRISPVAAGPAKSRGVSEPIPLPLPHGGLPALNKVNVPVSGPVAIPLPGATLYLNRVSGGGQQITRQALYLENRSLPDVVVAEAVADYTCKPCNGCAAKPLSA